MNEQSDPGQDEIRLPLVVTGELDVPILFANYVHVSHVGSEFVLTFGQYSTPAIAGEAAARQAALRRQGGVPIKIVGRFGIPAQRMMDMVRALAENVSNYERQKGLDSASIEDDEND